MSKLNKQSKLNILSLNLEQKALRYINVTNRIKAETEIRSLLKDDLIPIIKNLCDDKILNIVEGSRRLIDIIY